MSRIKSLILAVLFAIPAAGADLAGVVLDPSGASISGAQVILRSASGGPEQSRPANAKGQFKFTHVTAGEYVLAARHPGFEESTQPVSVADKMKPVEIRLEVSRLREQVEVSGKISKLANSDPLYLASRNGPVAESYVVENLELKRDVGIFRFVSGTISFTEPVLGRVTKAVFVGNGQFELTPHLPVEKEHLQLIKGKDKVADTFNQAVLIFTDSTHAILKKDLKKKAEQGRAPDVLRDFQKRVRHRTDNPQSMTEAILTSESMDNIDADILADLLNPRRPGFFSAYLWAKSYGDLRFSVRPFGAVGGIQSPEEVALVKTGVADDDGIWYLSHTVEEFEKGTASAHEDKRVVEAVRYRIETVLGNNDRLTATAEFTFRGVHAGDRLIKFALLPNLRVSRLSMNGQDVPYIQEDRRADASFYAILPQPVEKGKEYSINVEYSGDKVVIKAGGGNFYVAARTSWYPSINDFNDRAHYDLTFKCPKNFTMVSVGKLEKQWIEEKFACSRWVTDTPLAVAGFNFGEFKKKTVEDERTKYSIEGFAAVDTPDYLKMAEREMAGLGSLTPARLLDKAMSEAQASLQIFSDYFGRPPYGRIAITQQPQFNFGQSWPGLVYLPMSAFLDQTQRYRLMGGINSKLTQFVDEVTAHEVAHQWWGHMVGWATYRDQWLSEGLAEFSASLFLEATQPKQQTAYWQRARERLMQKQAFGISYNDAEPIWMGLRATSLKAPRAYQELAYTKGAYVIQMLRMLMWEPKSGDADFKKMMHDFTSSHLHKNASTESFLMTVNRHMKPQMNLGGDGTMVWFFSQWIYSKQVPRYKFDYKIEPGEGEGVTVKATLTQSEVDDMFTMAVPIYIELDKERIFRAGTINIRGSKTADKLEFKLPNKPKRILINARHDILERL